MADITKEQAIDHLKADIKYWENTSVSVDHLYMAIQSLEERKQGEWIGEKAYPICPKCKCDIVSEYINYTDYAEVRKPMKFCPNCGAKMQV